MMEFQFLWKGITMFSIADFLDRAKARALIDSDYRLAKVIGITHSGISSYRMGKSLPNEAVIEQLCALSGDDPDLIAAQIQAARAKTGPAQVMWSRIALRLSGAAGSAILSLVITIGLIAPDQAQAGTTAPLDQYSAAIQQHIHRIKCRCVSGLVSGLFFLERLRYAYRGLPGICRLMVCAAL
jgi:transcriptional regulator with XRE-family HTH domain